MTFLTKNELRRLLTVAYARNRGHHLALLVAFLHGLRVSEVLAIKGVDIVDGQLSVRRLKNSRATIHGIRSDTNPVFDESVVVDLAQRNPGRLFAFSRQRLDEVVKKYGTVAGIHPKKLHVHSLKHSIAVRLWEETHDLSAIQDHLGHKSASSTLIYMRTDAAQKAQTAIRDMAL